ncbi:MAG: DUF4091 domain-containing protein [Phycisphaerae bacterium]|nr:DUF4091 domain-containing protein [Phycisphaerae bacterium]
MKRIFWAIVLLAAVAADLNADALVQRGTNLVRNGGFETDGDWEAYGHGFVLDDTAARTGRRSLRCTASGWDSVAGAKQLLTFDPPVMHPLRVSGWSRADQACVARDYDLYLDIHYDDGSHLWAQMVRFTPGTHDWEHSELTIPVARAVRQIELHALFRKATGTVWFDDVEVTLAPFAWRQVRIVPGLYGPFSLAVQATTSLPASWEVTLSTASGVLDHATGQRLPIRLDWSTSAAGGKGGPPERVHLRIRAVDDLRKECLDFNEEIVFRAGSPGEAETGFADGAMHSCAAWVTTSMERVFPHSLPGDGPPVRKLQMDLAGGERESVQVVLRPSPGTTLRGVEVDITDLLRAESSARIPRSDITWHQVGFIRADDLWPHAAARDDAPGWWPDPLLKVPSFDVPPAFSQPVWVTVYAAPETPAGLYCGELTIRPGTGPPIRLPVEATVHPFALPAQGRLQTAFALMDGYLENVYGRPVPDAIRRRYEQCVLAHGLNVTDISRTSPPHVKDLLAQQRLGQGAYNVMNLVEERGSRTWVCNSPLSTYTPEFMGNLVERIEPFMAEAQAAGVSAPAYMYGFDEQQDEFYPVIRTCFGKIKQRYPQLNTMTTARLWPEPDVLADLNVDWAVVQSCWYTREQADRCRAAGRRVWAYICCDPRYPYANIMADYPLIETRVLGWQAFAEQMDGLLYWGLNIWDRPGNDRPVDLRRGPLLEWSIRSESWYGPLYGDGRLLYPGPDGPVESIRLANLRDGLEDYSYLWALAYLCGQPGQAERLAREVSQDLTHFTRDAQVLLRVRRAVVQAVNSQPGADPAR